ncbi:MAG: hypothetical protein ABI718_00515 [Acidobacteriota bacterium]
MSDASRNAVAAPSSFGRTMLSKVPEVTLYFWVVKVLCTTVGETAADLLNENLHLGLTGTTVVMGILLVIALIVQFRTARYAPAIYWLVVVFLSVFGTLITDNLTDNLHVPLTTTSIIFAVALAIVFATWYWFEKSLSIHSIYTTRRESFYWLAILFTFALGTAVGDLVAEQFKVGYLLSAGIFAAIIAIVALAHFRFGANAILSFWIAYIVTRPLGASLGDYLSQYPKDGGLGLGAVVTSVIFLAAILIVVTYLAVTKKDAPQERNEV